MRIAVIVPAGMRSGGDSKVGLPVVEPPEPISNLDARLLAEGWLAQPDRKKPPGFMIDR